MMVVEPLNVKIAQEFNAIDACGACLKKGIYESNYCFFLKKIGLNKQRIMIRAKRKPQINLLYKSQRASITTVATPATELGWETYTIRCLVFGPFFLCLEATPPLPPTLAFLWKARPAPKPAQWS